jgi:hypothetical protein
MFIVGKTFLEGLLTLVPSGILNNNSATLPNCSLGVPPKPLILASSNFSGLDLKSSNTSIISFCLALASLPSNTLTSLSVSLISDSLSTKSVSGVLASATSFVKSSIQHT